MARAVRTTTVVFIPILVFTIFSHYFPIQFGYLIAVLAAWIFADWTMKGFESGSHRFPASLRESDSAKYAGLVIGIMLSATLGGTLGTVMETLPKSNFSTSPVLYSVVEGLKVALAVILMSFYYILRQSEE